ncbi:MAG: inositol monophosphatase family protein [Spirochaetaceae bacterium]
MYYTAAMPLTTWDTDRVAELLIEAGHTAFSYYETNRPALKDDRSIVTEADKRIEARLAEELDAPKAGVYMIGEETSAQRTEDYLKGALSGRTWLVDPIDGTVPYAHRLPHWGVSIGMMDRGRIVEGGIFLPTTGELLLTNGLTDGAEVLIGRLGCEPERWKHWDAGRLQRLDYTPRSVPGGGVVSLAQAVIKRGRFTGEYTIHAVGACVYSVVTLLTGSIVGYVASVKLWDIAAGVAMFRKLGFCMKFEDGTPYHGEVDEKSYRLGPDSPKRFAMRAHLFIAPDEATCDDIIANTHW